MVRTLLVVSVLVCGLLVHNQDGVAAPSPPLMDCRSQPIDLLLVAHGVEDGFGEQMVLFSLVVDLFLGPDETELDRLRVALLVYRAVPLGGFQYTQVFDYSRFDNRTQVQNLLKHIVYSDVQFDTDNSSAPTNVSLSSVVGARRHAQHASVMVTEKSLVNSLFEGDQEYTSSASKIFLVVVDEPLYRSPTTFEWENSVLVKDYASLEHTQDIAVGLCGTCFSEWFGFEQHHGESLLWTYSCYLLGANKNRIAWTDALKMCEQRQASLASIETAEELDFLRHILDQRSDALVEDMAIIEVPYEFPIQIGLTRDRGSLTNRFKWVNNSPLTVTNWGDLGSPNGGYIQSCGAWIFRRLETMNNWDDFGCGYTNAHFYLCEANVRALNPGYIRNASMGDVPVD